MFVTEEQFKDLDYKKLDELLENVYNKAIEATLKLMPEVIVGLVVKTKGIQSTYSMFTEKFPQLADKKQEIMQILQDLELEDGSRSLEELLALVPERIKDLNIEIPTEQPHTIEEVERTANGFI